MACEGMGMERNSFLRRAVLFRSAPITMGGLALFLVILSITEGVPHLMAIALLPIGVGCLVTLVAAVETLSVLHVDQNGICCTVLGKSCWTYAWKEIRAFEFGRGYFTKIVKITFRDNEENRVVDIEITRRCLKILRDNCPLEEIRAKIDGYTRGRY